MRSFHLDGELHFDIGFNTWDRNDRFASLRAGRRANRVVVPASAADLHGWRAAFRVLVAMILAGGACIRLLPPRARHFERQRRIGPGLLAMARHPRNPRPMSIYACAFNDLFVFVSAFTQILMFLPNLFGAAANPFAGRWMGRVGYRTGLIAALAIDTPGILLTRVPNLVVALIGVFVAQTTATGRMGAVAGKAKSAAAGARSAATTRAAAPARSCRASPARRAAGRAA